MSVWLNIDDHILAVSCNPKTVFDELQARFAKKSIGPPKTYLGAAIGEHLIGDATYLHVID
jgi:hypothetical protein